MVAAMMLRKQLRLALVGATNLDFARRHNPEVTV